MFPLTFTLKLFCDFVKINVSLCGISLPYRSRFYISVFQSYRYPKLMWSIYMIEYLHNSPYAGICLILLYNIIYSAKTC